MTQIAIEIHVYIRLLQVLLNEYPMTQINVCSTGQTSFELQPFWDI